MSAVSQIPPMSGSCSEEELEWSQCWDFAPQKGCCEVPKAAPPAAKTYTAPSTKTQWWSQPQQGACRWSGDAQATSTARWPAAQDTWANRGAASCLNPAFVDASDTSDSSDDEDSVCDREFAALMAGLALRGHTPSVDAATKSTRSPLSSTPTRSAASPLSVPSPRSSSHGSSSPQASTRSPRSPALCDTPPAATPAPRAILKLEECLPQTPGRVDAKDTTLLLAQAISRLSVAPPPGLAPPGPPPGLGCSTEEAQTADAEAPSAEASLPSTLKLSRGERLKLVPPQCQYQGTLKMLNEVHGYGFIACPQVREVYQRDTYLPKALVPEGIKVGDGLVFTMDLSSKGRPMVTKVSIIV